MKEAKWKEDKMPTKSGKLLKNVSARDKSGWGQTLIEVGCQLTMITLSI